MLARLPSEITVGEVLRFVEGSRSSKGAKRTGETPFSEMWRRIDRAVSEVLDHTTFAELAREWKSRQEKYVPNWDI